MPGHWGNDTLRKSPKHGLGPDGRPQATAGSQDAGTGSSPWWRPAGTRRRDGHREASSRQLPALPGGTRSSVHGQRMSPSSHGERTASPTLLRAGRQLFPKQHQAPSGASAWACRRRPQTLVGRSSGLSLSRSSYLFPTLNCCSFFHSFTLGRRTAQHSGRKS